MMHPDGKPEWTGTGHHPDDVAELRKKSRAEEKAKRAKYPWAMRLSFLAGAMMCQIESIQHERAEGIDLDEMEEEFDEQRTSRRSAGN